MRRAYRRNPKAVIIAAVALVLVVAIAVVIFRFAFPEQWNRLLHGDPLYSASSQWKPGDLKVHFIDIGQGDFIYIQFPDGEDMVIDCGSTRASANTSESMQSRAVDYLAPFSDDDVINHLMLTHTDMDHVSYLDEIVYRYQIEHIYMPNILAAPDGKGSEAEKLRGQISQLDKAKLALFTDEDVVTTNAYANFFVAALSEQNCEIIINMDQNSSSNHVVISGDGYDLTFYCPTKAYYESTHLSDALSLNAVSPVGILTYKNRRVVFTGDSNSLNEPIIAKRLGYGVDCDVLKVAHHGAETSSLTEFLRAVTCEYAVISCGNGNSYDHPRQAALDRLRSMSFIYRTDLNGTIVFTVTKNGDMSFYCERESTREHSLVGADSL